MTGVDIAVTVGCTLFASCVGVVAGMVTGSLNSAEWRGSMAATLTAMKNSFDEDIARLENVDRDQWKSIGQRKDEIGKVAERVSRVEGRMARGAGAGG